MDTEALLGATAEQVPSLDLRMNEDVASNTSVISLAEGEETALEPMDRESQSQAEQEGAK